jgi:type VI secretion system secreted protein Hcp
MNKQSLRASLATGVLATSLLASSAATAAVDMFLKIDGITGETTDAKHKGEMDVLAWSWGQSVGAITGRGARPDVCIQNLSLTKYIESASPDLIMKNLIGEVARTAVLTIERPGTIGAPSVYLKLTMNNVTVTSYSTGGSGGEDRLTENVTLKFESMHGIYYPANSAQPVNFDIATGAANCR